jgi:hypothetical protein
MRMCRGHPVDRACAGVARGPLRSMSATCRCRSAARHCGLSLRQRKRAVGKITLIDKSDIDGSCQINTSSSIYIEKPSGNSPKVRTMIQKMAGVGSGKKLNHWILANGLYCWARIHVVPGAGATPAVLSRRVLHHKGLTFHGCLRSIPKLFESRICRRGYRRNSGLTSIGIRIASKTARTMP